VIWLTVALTRAGSRLCTPRHPRRSTPPPRTRCAHRGTSSHLCDSTGRVTLHVAPPGS